jgi:hypothetical protein
MRVKARGALGLDEIKKELAVALAVVALVALFAACARTSETPPPRVLAAPSPSAISSAEPVAPSPSPSPSEPASVTAPPDPPASTPARKAAWTDADYVAQLARDCSWRPLWHTTDEPNPLLCMAAPDGNDDPGYCFYERKEHCKPACVRTCSACDDTCVQGCYACKGRCTDDVCRLACATKCGQCKQACTTAQERCQVDRCNARYEVCREAVNSEWEKSPCSKNCDTLLTCVNTCAATPKRTANSMEGSLEARARCLDGCWPTVMRGCSRKKFAPFCPNLLF